MRLALLLLLAMVLPAVASQPDILLIMPDQMRGDCLSAVGHPVVHTPNIDALATEGVLFRRAYSTCPSCIPARFALLTGLYPSSSGVVGFQGKPIKFPTLPQLLAQSGYYTLLTGRIMHQVPAEESYGYQKRILGSTYINDDDYDTYLRRVAPESGGIRKVVARLGISFNGWEAKPWPLAAEFHPTAWTVRESQRVLREAGTNAPIFLTASFYAPHSPLFPLPRFFNSNLNLILPAPAHGNWVQLDKLTTNGNAQGDRVVLTGRALREAQAGYFGNIEQLDEAIAPLIADFKARSRRAGHGWVILFTSDHGEMLGDNGYYRKCEPYEGSANIPFIVDASADLKFKANEKPGDLVSLEDILPTLLELAGLKSPAMANGISLVPVLRGEGHLSRTQLHLEHAPCYNQEQAFQCLTDRRWKYIWRPLDGSEQLFDLPNDPHEEHDLSRDPVRQKDLAQRRAEMIHMLADRPEGFTDGKKLLPGRPYPALQVGREE